MPEPFIVPKRRVQGEQPVPFDPSKGTPREQTTGILGEPALAIEQTQPPWWQRAVYNVTAPIRWWSKSVTQPLAEIGTQWFRDIMDGDTENPDWQNVKAAWNAGMQKGGLFQALQDVGATRENRPDYFWGERFFGEVLADPANLIGWGLFGTAAKAGVRGAFTGAIKTGAIGSRLPILGEPLGRAEALYLAAALAPFRGFGKLVELTPLSNIQKGMHIQADVMYAGRKALGTRWQTNEGTVSHWYNSWRNEALAGNPLTEENAKFVGYMRRAENIAEDMPIEEAVADGGLLDEFFTNQATKTPQEFTTYLGDLLRTQEAKRAREFTEARIAGDLPKGTAGGQLGTRKWARMDFIRKQIVSTMEGSNAYKTSKMYQSFERWFLRAPAVAILSYSMYAPMNAMEEVFRTLANKMMPGWEKNAKLAAIIHSLAPPGVMEGVIATDIQNLKNQIDFVPGIIGKLTIGASNALVNMRRGTAINSFMSKAERAIAENPDYTPVVELLGSLRGLGLDKGTERTMRQLIIGNAYNNGSDFIGLANSVLSDQFFVASKLQEKIDRMYMQDLSPVAKQQLIDGAQQAATGSADEFGKTWAETLKVARETLTDDFARRPEVFSAAIANHLKHVKNTPVKSQADALYQIDTLREMQEELRKVLDSGNAARYDKIVKAMEAAGVDFKRVHREHNTWRRQSNKLSEQADKMFTEAIKDLEKKIKTLPGQAPLVEAGSIAAKEQLLTSLEKEYSDALLKGELNVGAQLKKVLDEVKKANITIPVEDWMYLRGLQQDYVELLKAGDTVAAADVEKTIFEKFARMREAAPELNSLADKIVRQEPLTLAEEQLRVNNAQVIEELLKARAGQPNQFAQAFGGIAQGMGTPGFADSAWSRLQAGEKMLFFDVQGSLEQKIQQAWDAKQINSRDDIVNIVNSWYGKAVPPSGATQATGSASALLTAFRNKYKAYHDQWTQGRDILEEHLANNPNDWLSYYRLEEEHIRRGIVRGEADEAFDKAHEALAREVGGDTVSADLAAIKELKPLMDQAREFAPTHADGFTMANANLDDMASAVLNDLPILRERWAAQSGVLEPYMKTLAKQLDDIPAIARQGYKDSVISSWDAAAKDLADAVTNYSAQRLIDETGTSFIPFWTYSTRALEWITRMGAQRPALGINFYPYGRYWEETDSGYLPTPLLGFQASPSRTMGILSKLRRWQTPDYPPQHAGLAGFWEEAQEKLARGGLFPAPAVNVGASLLTSIGDIAQGKPTMLQISESAPPWLTSALDLLYFGTTAQVPGEAPLPQPVIEAMNNIRNVGAIQDFADNAHTFLARSPYSEMFVRRYAWDTYKKAWSDLEPEQQRAAESGGAVLNAVSTQLGFVRYKPQSLLDERQKINELMAKEASVTVKEIEEAAKRGVPSWQIAPIDREVSKKLRALEGWKALLEMTVPLKDNEARLLSAGLSHFYKGVMERAEESYQEQEDLDAALLSDGMSTKAWRDQSNELWDSYDWKQGAEYGVGIQTPLFRTPEAKRLWLEGRGVEPPPELAFDRIVELYYSIQPQSDPLTGEEDISSFMRMRQEVIDTLPGELKTKMKNYLDKKTTPLRKEYEEGNRTFMRPYWDWQTYAPDWWETRGDRETATFFRGAITRAERAAKAKNDAIRQARSPQEREAVVRRYSKNYDMQVYRRIREQYRTRLMREDPRIFDFKMKFLEDIAI